MRYKSEGFNVYSDDGMCQQHIVQCETEQQAPIIAAALNDAARWRRLCTHMEQTDHGFIRRSDDNHTFQIGEADKTGFVEGRTMTEAIDAL